MANRSTLAGIRVSALSLFLLLATLPAALLGQDATGKITGVISDPSGATVAGAKVTVTNTGTQAVRQATTDANGNYQFLSLPIGGYEIAAEAPGFAKLISTGRNNLEINQTLRVDLQLQIGKQADTITVDTQASTVETENPTVGATVTGRAIFELPLNGRNALDLLQTQPGVTPTNPDNNGTGAGYSIGGGRTDSVTFLLDGGNNNNLLNNGYVANPNPDAIAEFRVLESNYSAEYGRNGGGIVSVVTKSGTNDLHGTAYDYLRNQDLNANDFFSNQIGSPRAVLKRNQFGGTIGGPILIPKVFNGRNKLFFFFSYQGQRQNSIAQQGNVNVFTPAETRGDFSQSAGASSVASFLLKNPQYQANPALASQGIIDPAKLDPVALNYLKANLVPVSPSGILFSQGAAKDNIDEYLGRFDYNLTSKDTISGTFSNHNETILEPTFSYGSGLGPNVPGYPDTRTPINYFGSVTWNHIFTPALLNEFRVTAQRNNALTFQPAGNAPTPASLGVGIVSDQPTGPTIMQFQGSSLFLGYSPNGPTNLIDNTYGLTDNLSWTVGNHNLKGGFYFSPYQNNTAYDYYINGQFSFYGPGTAVGSGYDFADFLLGLPDEYTQYPRAPSNIRSKQYAGYFQDSWKVTKQLTLNYGVRYEYSQPKFDTQGRSFSFIPGQQSTRFPGAPTNLVFPGDANAPRGSNFADKNDFAPRFGFAYDVFGNARTSLRGGIGMFYDILKAEDNLQFNGQVPFFAYTDFNFGTATTAPTGYYSDPFGTTQTVNPFPSKPPSRNLNFANAGYLPIGGGGVYFVDPNLRTPYVFQYNLSLQQELSTGLVAEIGYLGSSSHKLTGLVDQNPYIPGNASRIFGSNFSYLDEFQNVGKANYNALQTSITKRITNGSIFGGVFLTGSYTWAHSIDNESGYRQRNNQVPYFNHDYFRASSDFDVRHALSISGGWDLPFDQIWQHGPKLLTKGWSVYPIVTWRTGFPLDVFAALRTANANPGPAGDGQAGLVRADLVGNTVTTFDAHNTQTLNGQIGNFFFNPANFSNARLVALNNIAKSNPALLVGQASYGSFPRNGLRGPGFVSTDLSIAKHLYFFNAEKLDLELRGDAFNVFNHTNFANPDTNISDPTFGTVSAVAGASSTTNPTGPRIIQVALHLRF